MFKKSLVLVSILLTFSGYSSDKYCEVKTALYEEEAKAIDGCVSAITIDGIVVSRCFSEGELLSGVVDAQVRKLVKAGICKDLPQNLCRVKFARNDAEAKAIDGCVVAIVKNGKKVSSQCFSGQDYIDNMKKIEGALIKKELKQLEEDGVCPTIK